MLTESPKTALEADIEDLRQIYKQDGLYNDAVEKALQEVIRQNNQAHPGVFDK